MATDEAPFWGRHGQREILMSNEHDDEEQIDSHHDLAHELAERLLLCIDAFVAEKGKAEAPLPVILLATEIPASVTRRLCHDAGMTKVAMKHLQGQASECSMLYHEERTPDAKTKAVEGLSGFVVMLPNPGLKH